MSVRKCPLSKDTEISLPDEDTTLESTASAPDDEDNTDEQPLTEKLLTLASPTNLSHSRVQLSVTGPHDNDLNMILSNNMRSDQVESIQSKRLFSQDAVTIGAGITIPAGAALRKRGLQKCSGDNNHQDSSARRVLRRHKLPTDFSNHPALDSSTTMNMSATGLDNERRLASSIVANSTISALPTLTNRLKLSEGLSSIDYLPAFRALAIGSTRQLHIVEVIPAVAYDVYRHAHDHLCNSKQQKAEESCDTDDKYPSSRETDTKDDREGKSTERRGTLPTHAIPIPSQYTPTEVYVPGERSSNIRPPGGTDFTHAGNESRIKWRSGSFKTAHNNSENSAFHTFTSVYNRNTSSGMQSSSANSNSPYVLRNAGVFGGLMKVESVAWYPSCNEASVAFVQPGRAVTVFLDALQFKSDDSYVSQQWRRSQGKGKTLHATQRVGGGSTATAVVAPSGFMLSSCAIKTNLTPSLSTPAWGKGCNVTIPTNPTITLTPSSGISSDHASVERSPGGVLAKELIELSIDCTYVRVECIAWDPHNPHTLALSSTLTHFELWHIPSVSDRVYAPQLVLRPPAHNTRSVARTLAFSPSDANLIIVIVESASAGQVLLFDRRQVEVPRSLDVMGPGLAAAFHPIFSDLLAVCFRKSKTKTDCRVAFLRVLENSHQVEIVKTGAPVLTSLGDTSYTEMLSGSTNSRTLTKGLQHHYSDVPHEEQTDSLLDAVSNTIPTTISGTEALLSSANVLEVPRVVQQNILKPVDHYASVNCLKWRPGSCGMKLSAESPDHHFRCWFPSPDPFAVLYSADAVTSHLSSSCFTGSNDAALRQHNRSQDFAEKKEGITPETEEVHTTASYAGFKSGVELLASQLWFATAATSTDSDVCVWDAVSGYVPVCVASHHTKDGRELSDFVWVNELTLVTVFKSGEVICTCLMNNNHFEDSVLVCPSLEANEDEVMADSIPRKEQHLSPLTTNTLSTERAAKDCGHMMLCYPPDSAVRVLSLHSIMPTSAVTCDLFGRSFVVRNTSSRLKDYYKSVIRSERKDLIRRLLLQVGNEEIQREKVAQRRGICIQPHFLFKEILHILFDNTKCNALSTICDVIEQDASDKAAQPLHMEVTGHSGTFSNTDRTEPSFLFFPTLGSSREQAIGAEPREKNIEAGGSIEPLSATGLNATLRLTNSSPSLEKLRWGIQNGPSQLFRRILGVFQRPFSYGHQECPPDIKGVDRSMATSHTGYLAAHEVRAPHSPAPGGQNSQKEPIEPYRVGTATENKTRVSTDTPHASSPIAFESYQPQPYQGGSTNLREVSNPLGRFSGTSDVSCLQGVARFHATLSEVSSTGQRNKFSLTQDCASQRPYHQTSALSFPVVNTISNRFPNQHHMAIFPLLCNPTTVCMEQSLTAQGSPIASISAPSDSLTHIKHSVPNPLEHGSLVLDSNYKNLAFTKEPLVIGESRTTRCKRSSTIKRDMGPLVLSRTSFPQSLKINSTVAISATAMQRHDCTTSLSLTPEGHSNCRLRNSPAHEAANLNSDNCNENANYVGSTLPEASIKLWLILNTSSMEHCVNPVIENCVLSNAACTWAYTECQTEANLFVRYSLEWDMGYELALSMKRHRHWLDDEAEKNQFNFKEELQKPGRKLPQLDHKAKVTKSNDLSALTFQPQQYVPFSSPKQIDIIFSNMMLHNCRICETQNSFNDIKVGKRGGGLGNDNDDRSPKDPRAQFWRAASHAWRTHDIETILSVTISQLEYTSLMGDVQYSLVLYVLFCLWWRLRHHAPHPVTTAFHSQSELATENGTQPQRRGGDDQQEQEHLTWEYVRSDPSDDTSSTCCTSSLAQGVVRNRSGSTENFSAMLSCPLLPGRSSRSLAVRQQKTPHTLPLMSKTSSPNNPQLSFQKTDTLFPVQPIQPAERQKDSSISVQGSPKNCYSTTSCTSEQWKLRALQWLEVYTSELYACKLYVPLNELLLIIPELFQEPYNPVQPRAADIAYEKQMTYVFCGNCTKSELSTFPVKGPYSLAYSSNPATSAMYRLNHKSSSVHVDMQQVKIRQHQTKASIHTSSSITAVNISEASKTLTPMYTEPQPSQLKSDSKDRGKQVLKELPRTEKRKRRRHYIRDSGLGVSHLRGPLLIHDDSDFSQETCESEDSHSTDFSYSFSRTSSTNSLATSISTENVSFSPQCESESFSLSGRQHRAKESQSTKEATRSQVDMTNRPNHHNVPTVSWKSVEDDSPVNNVCDEVDIDAVKTEEISISLLPGHAIPNNAECRRCHNTTAMTCVVCEEVVEGLFYWLRSCGHGGHVHHMQQWMSISCYCPKCGVPITSAASQQ
ncbi:unnamed protein product [Phytomonas sp. Hart1]|nr:unnamed protein product [Phytomonas sp. Hart1]|eukprot:CCW66405.1 unnamed protein product [Phytomonas sp. isolate Hart1]